MTKSDCVASETLNRALNHRRFPAANLNDSPTFWKKSASLSAAFRFELCFRVI